MVLNYICKSHESLPSGHDLYCRVVDMGKNEVTIDRYTDFGKLHWGVIKLSNKEFTNFYRKCEEGECIKIE